MSTTYTYDEIKKEIGKNLKYYNSATATWLTDKDVTETDIGFAVNIVYRDQIFPMFVNEHPKYFKKTSFFDSWVATGTVDPTTTGATLVATSGIFTSSMADQKLNVYNSTDGTSTFIEGYTSTTTVTVDDTDIADWVGDTIYVLGQEFSFAGDGTDLWTVTGVELLYTSSGTAIPANKTERQDIIRTGYEVGSKVYPEWYNTTVIVSDVPYDGIGIFPKMDAKVSNAIRVERTYQPAAMSADSDVPRLPVALPIILGATAYVMRQRGDQGPTVEYFDTQFERETARALTNWRPDRSYTPRITKLSRNYLSRRRR